MDESGVENKDKTKIYTKQLHFDAVNTRNEKSKDENKELLSGIRKPKFIVVPTQLPTSASQCGPDLAKTSDKGLKPISTSPGSIGLPAIVTPTRPSMYSNNFQKNSSILLNNAEKQTIYLLCFVFIET